MISVRLSSLTENIGVVLFLLKMLNRRTLRIKAVQTYFAYEQSLVSDYEIALQQIEQDFEPDLNSMEPQDTVLLKKKTQIAQQYFVEQYKNESIRFGEEADESIRKSLSGAVSFYRNQVKKDSDFFQKRMLKDIEKLYEGYYLALLLPVEFAALAAREYHKRKESLSTAKPLVANEFNLTDNRVVKALESFDRLQQQAALKSANWVNHREDTSNWYKDILKEDETYKQYQQLAAPTEEEELNIVLHIVKKLFFKNPLMLAFMEEKDLYWGENSSIVKSLAVKTLKSYRQQEEPFQLMELSANLEDDLEYFRELFRITAANDEEYERIIAEKSENWKLDRIALIDKVILKMALAEMINFPSIPVKVTINEFIEISKNYSTPKSKQFVNGLLDVLANDLTAKGVIKKSGRGLIDNK